MKKNPGPEVLDLKFPGAPVFGILGSEFLQQYTVGFDRKLLLNNQHCNQIRHTLNVALKRAYEMSAKNLIFFTIGFWLIAIILLFTNALPNAKMHMDVALVRYLYVFIISMLLSLALSGFYKTSFFSNKKLRLFFIMLACTLAVGVTSILVNPITFFLAGTDIRLMPERVFSSEVLLFWFLYLIWSLLYLHLSGRSLFKGGVKLAPGFLENFKVDKNGEKRNLPTSGVCLLKARGDYVELTSESDTYLIKDSLSKIEKLLDQKKFKRVHRSAIINCEKIFKIKANPGGTFEIFLKGGQKVKSSRSFKSVVNEILPPG